MAEEPFAFDDEVVQVVAVNGAARHDALDVLDELGEEGDRDGDGAHGGPFWRETETFPAPSIDRQ